MVKTFGEMDGTIEVLHQGQKKSGKLNRQINSATRSSLARSKKESPSMAPHKNVVVDQAKVSRSSAKLTHTGPHQHSYRESIVSRKRVMSEDTEGATELKRLPTPINLFEDECIFCHSFRTSPFHGPMVRYLKGRIVSIDEGNPSNGVYVHRKCLGWAPRVWLKDDTVMNLEIEIRRASRLRCSKCGLHGAALGCYYKPCNKNFHVPCAVQIFDCRWDVDNFHVLCSEHVSKTLLCDGLSSQTKGNDNSSSLPQSQYSDNEGDDYQRENQQTGQLILHCLGANVRTKKKLPLIAQGKTINQQLEKEEFSKYHERDYQQKHQLGKLKTSNSSSLRQSCHRDEGGILNACQMEEIKANQLETPSSPSDQWVLLGSSLSTSEKAAWREAARRKSDFFWHLLDAYHDSLQDFASWTNATLTKEWDKNVTHVIVGKNAGSTWSRSYEVLMAILSGKWVVQAECTKIVIRTAFCLSAYMNPDDRQRMQDLIAAAGGQILEGSNLHLLHENLDDSSVKLYFIHDGSALGEFAPSSLLDLRHKQMEETECRAAGAHVISLPRVLEAIAAYDAQILSHNDRLTPHVPYTSQHSDKEGISNDYERDDQQTDQLNTPNSSLLPQGNHPGGGMSNTYQREEIETDQPDTSICLSDQLVLLGLSLTVSEKDSLQNFAGWTNATVTKEWTENVTHVIVGKNYGSSWSRSYEVLMAILFGKWVVQIEWIVDCLELCPGPEASYEVTFSNDSHKTNDGPKKGRIRAAEGAPKLFSGLCFCLSYFMNPDDRHRMQDLIHRSSRRAGSAVAA